MDSFLVETQCEEVFLAELAEDFTTAPFDWTAEDTGRGDLEEDLCAF